jgi:hypothetical protein
MLAVAVLGLRDVGAEVGSQRGDAAAAVRAAAAAESGLSRASSMVAALPDDGSTAALIASLLQAQEELAARVRKLEETGNME